MLDSLIQLGILILAVASILYSQYSDRKQRRLMMFAEYTRRYQDIIMQMPDNIYLGNAVLDGRTLKYMNLYYDLCSEEYHLWRTGIVPQYIWTLWKDGMRITTQNEVYRQAWATLKQNYYIEFTTFFDREVIN